MLKLLHLTQHITEVVYHVPQLAWIVARFCRTLSPWQCHHLATIATVTMVASNSILLTDVGVKKNNKECKNTVTKFNKFPGSNIRASFFVIFAFFANFLSYSL